MSSAIYFDFKRKVPIKDWLDFCEQNEIAFHPNVIGQNAFYKNKVQVILDGTGFLPDKNGRHDFENAKPPDEFERLTVSSYFMSNLKQIADVATKVKSHFGGETECAAELQGFFSYGR